jgi:hypothetical protein
LLTADRSERRRDFPGGCHSQDQEDQKEYEEQPGQELRDSDCGASDSRKSQCGGNQTDDQKQKSQFQHEFLLTRSGAKSMPVEMAVVAAVFTVLAALMTYPLV